MRDSHPSVPGVCDSYRKRQRNVTERTECRKGEGKASKWKGKRGGTWKGEARGPKEYDLCATRTKVKREINSISRNVSLVVETLCRQTCCCWVLTQTTLVAS